jgi:hypothetical protein
MSLEERLQRLEALLVPKLPGTQITRIMKQDHGFEWCVAIGVMSMPKLFFRGATVEEALALAEDALLTPKVPTAQMLRALYKHPNQPIFQGPGIRALLNLDGINMQDYAPKRRKPAATAAAAV